MKEGVWYIIEKQPQYWYKGIVRRVECEGKIYREGIYQDSQKRIDYYKVNSSEFPTQVRKATPKEVREWKQKYIYYTLSNQKEL